MKKKQKKTLQGATEQKDTLQVQEFTEIFLKRYLAVIKLSLNSACAEGTSASGVILCFSLWGIAEKFRSIKHLKVSQRIFEGF